MPKKRKCRNCGKECFGFRCRKCYYKKGCPPSRYYPQKRYRDKMKKEPVYAFDKNDYPVEINQDDD